VAARSSGQGPREQRDNGKKREAAGDAMRELDHGVDAR
jgi:hypothetical protein